VIAQGRVDVGGPHQFLEVHGDGKRRGGRRMRSLAQLILPSELFCHDGSGPRSGWMYAGRGLNLQLAFDFLDQNQRWSARGSC
jgi:hypothetical protein